MSSTGPSSLSDAARRRNRKVAAACLGGLALMVGAAYAAVPAYRAFCQLTGFDGTVRKAEAAPTRVLDQTLLIHFDTNVRGDLPWEFEAEQVSQTLRIGETGTAFFKVTNTSDRPITGRATYNVVPEQAGPYFRKLECFCFSDQTIQPGQTVEFPMIYFVDPEYAEDFETRGKGEITLSYSYFPSPPAAKGSKTAQLQQVGPASPLGGSADAGL
ncbi:cytochrome c oxidase assembly protein [Phenylobacterium terrae]|uniref:Cytochrome c oxidase assembly protein CtaG n=1 Tax=Phenylobacterium terrae TaxID=2665495 RepID=A0ABW4N1T5_9CAUL